MANQDYFAKTKAYLIKELSIANSKARNYKRDYELAQKEHDNLLKQIEKLNRQVLIRDKSLSNKRTIIASLSQQLGELTEELEKSQNLMIWLPSLLEHYEKQAKLNGFTPDTSLTMVRSAINFNSNL